MRRIIILATCLIVTIFILFKGYDIIFSKSIPMNDFSKAPLDNKLRQDMIKKNIWSSNCPVSLDRLNLLRVSYIDFDGNEKHNGAIIVHDVVADHVLSIFKELYDKKFPIASINLINEYDGNDEKSMEHNNSSAFNCRNISNSKLPSIHSFGLAIDINPQQNPYLLTEYEPGKTHIPVFPALGMQYLNRTNIRAGMVESVIDDNSRETVIDIFHKHGFTIWGGSWNFPIDWHHFQLTREQSETIIKLPFQQGLDFFNKIASSKAHATGKLASNNIDVSQNSNGDKNYE